MKKIHVFGLAVLLAAAMALPASAAMWVGGEVGANFIGSNDLNLTFPGPNTARFKGTSFDASVIGGITFGYDFVNSGCLGYAYPDWMKYFGFAIDYTYNRASLRSQTRDLTVNGIPVGPNRLLTINSQSDGYVSALTFLFYGHYGFFPDSEVPSGRLHPYVGVGPAIVWTGLDLGSEGVGKATATNVALVAEAGLRYMALANVSIDVAFRYRYYTPSWDFSTPGGTVNADMTINSYSFLTRVAYHF